MQKHLNVKDVNIMIKSLECDCLLESVVASRIGKVKCQKIILRNFKSVIIANVKECCQ